MTLYEAATGQEPKGSPAEMAAEVYLLRKDGIHYPVGHFSHGKWFPDPVEVGDCCRKIRRPSNKWPYSLLRHCYTLKHIATVFWVSPREVREVLPMVVLGGAK